jgi:hypothetical protein
MCASLKWTAGTVIMATNSRRMGEEGKETKMCGVKEVKNNNNNNNNNIIIIVIKYSACGM